MDQPEANAVSSSAAVGADQRFDELWALHRPYILGLAKRTLGESSEAEDVVQEAFDRLARANVDEIDDVRGWLAVVTRRLCLDRIRSARARHETPGSALVDAWPLFGRAAVAGADEALDPADRVTLDDQVQLALAIVLDRLTPAERTAFLLHDVFGFPFDDVGAIVGRTAAACRQLASRARRSIRSDEGPVRSEPNIDRGRVLAERFIAACAGGDLGELVELLDPEVAGLATLVGGQVLTESEGRDVVAERLMLLFGPESGRTLVPISIEDETGFIAFDGYHAVSVIRASERDGKLVHFHAVVRFPPSFGEEEGGVGNDFGAE